MVEQANEQSGSRAKDYGSGGWEFDSSRARQVFQCLLNYCAKEFDAEMKFLSYI